MKSTRILIVSPDQDAAAEVGAGLKRVGFACDAETLGAFPSRGDLRQILNSDQSVDALLLNYADEQPALQCLRDIRAVHPAALTVMFNGSRRLSSLVKAKQGGVWGYLTDLSDLKQLADHFGLAEAVREEPKTGALVAFLPSQGGSGASTVCLHVAERVAASRPGKTLLVDCDLHTGTVAFQLGLEPRKTLLDALDAPTVENARSYPARWGDLAVLVGPADPEGIFEGPLDHMDELLQAARQSYDCVVVDLPAPIYSSTTWILRTADSIYLVCTPEITSLHLAKRKIDRLRKLGVADERLRLLLNRSGSTAGLDSKQIERITGVAVEWALDNDYRAVASAALRGGLVPKGTALAQQLEQLGELIVKQLGPSAGPAKPPASASAPSEAVRVG